MRRPAKPGPYHEAPPVKLVAVSSAAAGSNGALEGARVLAGAHAPSSAATSSAATAPDTARGGCGKRTTVTARWHIERDDR